MESVECITWEGKLLAYVIRGDLGPEKSSFFTPPESTLQMGFVVYPAGRAIARHVHKPLERQIVGTAEAILVKSGRCEVDIYSDDRDLVATRTVQAGDMLLLVGGGHGFRTLEDTVLVEIKQGPYLEVDEKERF